MTSTVYINGKFVPESEAVVTVFDGGWLHGAGLFETMRAEYGSIFRLESHMARLQNSAKVILRPLEQGDLPGEAVFEELLQKNELTRARIRLTISAGAMRSKPEQQEPQLTVCVTASPLFAYPERYYEAGIQVMLSRFKQSVSDPIAGHKTTAYLPRILSLREAQQARCVESIWFTSNNELAEGSISNVFVLDHGVLKTPGVETPILPGIARGVVLELAREAEIEVRQCALNINDLLDADEVFLTNAIMQVMPVIRVEKHDIKGGKVGETTRRLLHGYRDLVRKECGRS